MSMYPRELGTIPEETLRAVQDDLAALASDWLVKQISPDWFERYSHRVENYRLPKAESQRIALAQQIGADGLHLLQALSQPDAPADLSEVESVQMLRQVWRQYYELSKGKAKRAKVRGLCVLLAKHGLLPEDQFVDTGYVNAELLVSEQNVTDET
jgi:hypothetical protein